MLRNAFIESVNATVAQRAEGAKKSTKKSRKSRSAVEINLLKDFQHQISKKGSKSFTPKD